MRAGLVVSATGHAGIVAAILMAGSLQMCATVAPPISNGAVVPVEVVDVGAISNVRALAIPMERGRCACRR